MINSFVQRKNICNTEYVIYKNLSKQFLVTMTYQNIFITKDGKHPIPILSISNFYGYWFSGDLHYSSALLIKISAYDYVHIGPTIYSFRISEPAIGYVSPINNVEKYPILLAENNAYMLGEIGYLKMKRCGLTLKNGIELYDRFYSNTYEKEIIMLEK